MGVGFGQGVVILRLLAGGTEHDALAAQRLELPQPLAQLRRRDFTHGHTQHRDLDRLLARARGDHRILQLIEAVERQYRQPAGLQLMLQRLACQRMLFQQSHPAPQQRGTWQVLGIVTRLGQAQADPEFGAFLGNAVDADLTAHLLDQAFGNHQPQAGAPRLPGDRIVRLAERLEQRAQVLIGQADAGVLHADAQLGTVAALVFDHRADHHGAFVGELDGVADQVGQHLLEPQRIAHQRQRRVAIDKADQLQLLGVRGRAEDGQGVLDQVAQVEGHALQHQLAGFDLREVENLVDDAQQAVGGLFDGRQVILLARGEIAFLQQVGETQNPVERRADLVAHVGEKLGFDPARFQRLLARQIQLDVLDLDGFQVLLHVLGGLVDALLQFLACAEQRLGHAVDTRGEFVHLVAAERRQPGFQIAVLELRHRRLHPVQRRADGAAHAQRQQGGEDQARADQQQTGEQAAVAAQQGALVGQFELQPADLALHVARRLGGEVQMAPLHRHQDARGFQAADLGQRLGIGRRRRGDHVRPGVGQQVAPGIQRRHRAHVGLIEYLIEDALQALAVTLGHCRGRQRRQLLGEQMTALLQLQAHLRELHRGEVDAQHHCQQRAGQQRQHQHAALDSQMSQHGSVSLVDWHLV